MPSFDLTTQPWIPCVLPDGTQGDRSLGDALIQAHEIREIVDPSPLVTVALHRLMLAILHRAHNGPPSFSAWEDLWRSSRWSPDLVGSYLGTWRHRFDLFHPDRPFYQGPSLGEHETQHPVSRLAQEVATGNNATLFDHGGDALSPAAAARYLVAHLSFAIGFGKSLPFYLKDSPALRGYNVFGLGDTLFQTLALNLLPYNSERPLPWHGDDLPAWEQDPPPEPRENGSIIHGYLDYLTWQSRRVHLIPEGDPVRVRFCQFRQHLAARDIPLDPFKAYRIDPERGRLPRGLNPDRALWRDSHTLLQRAAATAARPEVFNHLARVDTARHAGTIFARPSYRVAIFGFATDVGKAASVILWRQERLPIPLAYLDDDLLLASLNTALGQAEEIGRLFAPGFSPRKDDPKRQAPRPLQILAETYLPTPADSRPDQAAIDRFLDHLDPSRRYWVALELPFRRLLLDLPNDRTLHDDGDPVYGETTLPIWAAEVRRHAWRAFDDATRGLDTSARALKATALARRAFAAAMRDRLDPWLDSPKETADVRTLAP